MRKKVKEKGGKIGYSVGIEYPTTTIHAPEDFIKQIAIGLVSDLVKNGAIVIDKKSKEHPVITVKIAEDHQITVVHAGKEVFKGSVEMHCFSAPTGGYGVGEHIHDRLRRMTAGTSHNNMMPYGRKKPPFS